MAKLGYTFYPKDWGNSESVFELNLSERGLYRELIDMAMLNDNKTDVKIDVWSRKFSATKDEINAIIDKLTALKLIEIRDEKLFIQSCESRLVFVRTGRLGGESNKGIAKGTPKGNAKGISKGISKGKAKQRERKEKEKDNKIEFTASNIFDKVTFAKEFPNWNKKKLLYYYESALRYSNEGNKYIDWKAAISNWARRDEAEGKLKFEEQRTTANLQGHF